MLNLKIIVSGIVVFLGSLSAVSCNSASVSESQNQVSEESVPPITTTPDTSRQEIVSHSPMIDDKNGFYTTMAVCNGKVTMSIPSTFQKMSPAMIKAKYPRSGTRPTEVYANETYGINIGFSHTTQPTSTGELAALEKTIVNQIQAAAQNIKSSIQKINGDDYIVIEFVSNALDSKIYNLMFITDIDGRAFIGTFNCVTRLQHEWEPRGKEMLSSIKKVN